MTTHCRLLLTRHNPRAIRAAMRITRPTVILALLALTTASCGSASSSGNSMDPSVVTGLPPVISTVAPAVASLAAGTVVTISGFGYSISAPSNIITVTNGTTSAAVSASSYALVAAPTATDIEALTFTIPPTAPLGVLNVYVTIFDNTSNTNLTLTVVP